MLLIDKGVIKKSIEHYGTAVQSTVCMEECAELIQAISKEIRYGSHEFEIAEEMADVYICLEQLKEMYNIPEKAINTYVAFKQARMKERMEGDDYQSNHEDSEVNI